MQAIDSTREEATGMQPSCLANEHGAPKRLPASAMTIADARGPLVVRILPGGDADVADELSRRFGISITREETPRDKGRKSRLEGRGPDALVICVGPDGLSLACRGLCLEPDLSRMLPRIRQGRLQQELLVRAAKVRGGSIHDAPRAIDATAGMGEDSLLLAAAGFEVTLYERNPVLAMLLADLLRRAARVPELAGPVSRMRLVEGDSIHAMCELAFARGPEGADGPIGIPPDVVLLDPMFPERRKSAAVHKKAQLLQRLESPCNDEGELLAAALATGARKVVVKRPVKGPVLAEAKPSYSIRGKSVRYDVFVTARE